MSTRDEDNGGRPIAGHAPVHQVTSEMMARGNELLREAAAARDRGFALSKARDELEKLGELAWLEHDRKSREARLVFTGLRTGY